MLDNTIACYTVSEIQPRLKLLRPSPIRLQETAESVQLSWVGLTTVESSRVPAFTYTWSGCVGEDVNIGEPQSEQK